MHHALPGPLRREVAAEADVEPGRRVERRTARQAAVGDLADLLRADDRTDDGVARADYIVGGAADRARVDDPLDGVVPGVGDEDVDRFAEDTADGGDVRRCVQLRRLCRAALTAWAERRACGAHAGKPLDRAVDDDADRVVRGVRVEDTAVGVGRDAAGKAELGLDARITVAGVPEGPGAREMRDRAVRRFRVRRSRSRRRRRRRAWHRHR